MGGKGKRKTYEKLGSRNGPPLNAGFYKKEDWEASRRAIRQPDNLCCRPGCLLSAWVNKKTGAESAYCSTVHANAYGLGFKRGSNPWTALDDTDSASDDDTSLSDAKGVVLQPPARVAWSVASTACQGTCSSFESYRQQLRDTPRLAELHSLFQEIVDMLIKMDAPHNEIFETKKLYKKRITELSLLRGNALPFVERATDEYLYETIADDEATDNNINAKTVRDTSNLGESTSVKVNDDQYEVIDKTNTSVTEEDSAYETPVLLTDVTNLPSHFPRTPSTSTSSIPGSVAPTTAPTTTPTLSSIRKIGLDELYETLDALVETQSPQSQQHDDRANGITSNIAAHTKTLAPKHHRNVYAQAKDARPRRTTDRRKGFPTLSPSPSSSSSSSPNTSTTSPNRPTTSPPPPPTTTTTTPTTPTPTPTIMSPTPPPRLQESRGSDNERSDVNASVRAPVSESSYLAPLLKNSTGAYATAACVSTTFARRQYANDDVMMMNDERDDNDNDNDNDDDNDNDNDNDNVHHNDDNNNNVLDIVRQKLRSGMIVQSEHDAIITTHNRSNKQAQTSTQQPRRRRRRPSSSSSSSSSSSTTQPPRPPRSTTSRSSTQPSSSSTSTQPASLMLSRTQKTRRLPNLPTLTPPHTVPPSVPVSVPATASRSILSVVSESGF